MSHTQSNHYGDCDHCKHQDSARCDDCMHLERVLRDNWEAITPAESAEREARDFQAAVEAAITDWVNVSVSDAFRRHFETAKRFAAHTATIRYACLGVYADPAGYLVATDSYVLCKLYCDCIPDALKGKVIITMEEDKAGICNESFPIWEFIFNSIGYKDVLYSEVIKQFKDVGSKGASVSLGVDGNILLLKDEYLELVEAVLGPKITMRYRLEPSRSPVIFVGPAGMAALQPLLNGSDVRQRGSAVKGTWT